MAPFRYDGNRRNPFDEIECGDHYSRAMAGWSVLEAVTGFRYDGTRNRIMLTATSGRFPFVAGTGGGMAEVAENGSLELSCLGGQLQVDEVLILVSSVGGQEAEPVHMRVERTLGEGERLVLEGES
jgi:non-lysosomal glucosylceramidase